MAGKKKGGNTVAVFAANAEVILCRGIALFCGFGVPFNSFGKVFLYAVAVVIAISETALSVRVALACRLCKKLNGFCVILLHTVAIVILFAFFIKRLCINRFDGNSFGFFSLCGFLFLYIGIFMYSVFFFFNLCFLCFFNIRQLSRPDYFRGINDTLYSVYQFFKSIRLLLKSLYSLAH